MIIGIDIDNVLGDLNLDLNLFSKSYFDLGLNREDYIHYDLSKIWNCSVDSANNVVKDYYNSGRIRNLKPLPNSIEVIQKLAENNELISITARSRFISDDTLDWLNDFFPAIDKVLFSQSKIQTGKRKWEIALDEGVDVMIDDAPHVISDVSEKGIFCIIMDAPWNRHISETDNVVRISNWSEVPPILEKLKKEIN